MIPTLLAAGAELVESINPRDISKGWVVDDPTIPNMSIQKILAEMIPTLEPMFANAAPLASPSTTTGLLPGGLRQAFDPTTPLFPAGTDLIQKSVEMFYGTTPFPDSISDSIAWLSYDGRPNRGYNAFTDASGLPDIGVPAGFTEVVYDRTTRGEPSEALALDPSAVKREVALPFSVQFIGRMWSEPLLLEIASAYEYARGPRTPPPGFGPIPNEP